MNPLIAELNPLVSRISERGLLSETFHKTAPMSSCDSEEKERRNNMCSSGFFEGTFVEVGSPTCSYLGGNAAQS